MKNFQMTSRIDSHERQNLDVNSFEAKYTPRIPHKKDLNVAKVGEVRSGCVIKASLQ